MIKFLTALIAVAAVGLGIEAFRFLSSGPGTAKEEMVFEVPPGKTFHQLAYQLEKQGLVSSALKLRILAKLSGQGSHIKHGEYALNKSMTPQEILSVLVSGKSILYPVTFPEGSNLYEMAAMLEGKNLYKAE